MRFDQRAQLKELGQRCIEGHCVSVNAIFKVSVIDKCLALTPSPPSTPYLPLALRSPPSQKAHASQWAQAQANRYTTVASSPTLHVHAVRKVCSGNTTPGVDPLIIAVLHHHAAHKIHVNAVFEGAAGVGGAAVACCRLHSPSGRAVCGVLRPACPRPRQRLTLQPRNLQGRPSAHTHMQSPANTPTHTYKSSPRDVFDSVATVFYFHPRPTGACSPSSGVAVGIGAVRRAGKGLGGWG